MAKLIRFGLLSGSVFYFALCIVASLEVNYMLHQIMIALFLLFGFIVIIRYSVLLIAAIRENGNIKTVADSLWRPFISIIVPAFNEENLIEAALVSLTVLDYSNYEIIVVDDGSTDKTASIARKVAEHNPQIRISVISQSNSGKSWALNTGIEHAQGDLVVCVDSDSRLSQDALKIGVHHFKDQQVGAIGGFVSVINNNKLITKFQQIEYVIGQNFLRLGLSFFNMVTVIPGPIGMFRKKAVQQVGGYNTLRDCFAEDADLTVRLLSHGWHVKADSRMIAYTQAPDTLFTFLRQRYRWKRGIFQTFYDNFYCLVTSSNIKCVSIAAILIFESFLFDIMSFGITLFALTSFFVFADLKFFLWAFAIISLLDLVVLVFSHAGQGHLDRVFLLFLLQKITYAYVLQAWGVLALFDELTATKMSWDKLERTEEIPLRIEV